MEIKTTLFSPKLKNTQTYFANFLSAFDGEDGKNGEFSTWKLDTMQEESSFLL